MRDMQAALIGQELRRHGDEFNRMLLQRRQAAGVHPQWWPAVHREPTVFLCVGLLIFFFGRLLYARGATYSQSQVQPFGNPADVALFLFFFFFFPPNVGLICGLMDFFGKRRTRFCKTLIIIIMDCAFVFFVVDSEPSGCDRRVGVLHSAVYSTCLVQFFTCFEWSMCAMCGYVYMCCERRTLLIQGC